MLDLTNICIDFVSVINSFKYSIADCKEKNTKERKPTEKDIIKKRVLGDLLSNSCLCITIPSILFDNSFHVITRILLHDSVIQLPNGYQYNQQEITLYETII